MIRRATLDDMPKILEWLKIFHGQSLYSSLVPFDPISAQKTTEHLINDDGAVIFTNGHGLIGGVAVPFFFNHEITQIIEMFWFAEKGGRGLKRAFEQWGRENGASVVVMGSVSHSRQDTVDKIYKRQGFVESERLFLKRL